MLPAAHLRVLLILFTIAQRDLGVSQQYYTSTCPRSAYFSLNVLLNLAVGNSPSIPDTLTRNGTAEWNSVLNFDSIDHAARSGLIKLLVRGPGLVMIDVDSDGESFLHTVLWRPPYPRTNTPFALCPSTRPCSALGQLITLPAMTSSLRSGSPPATKVTAAHLENGCPS